VQCERTKAATAHLRLDVAARPHEDCRRAGLLDRDLRRGNLRAVRAAELQQVASCIHHGDHHAVPVLRGVLLGGGHHRVDCRVVEHASGTSQGHGHGHVKLQS
jgi:hypothetical protein